MGVSVSSSHSLPHVGLTMSARTQSHPSPSILIAKFHDSELPCQIGTSAPYGGSGPLLLYPLHLHSCIHQLVGNIRNRSVITSDGREGGPLSLCSSGRTQIRVLNDPWMKETTRNNDKPYDTSSAAPLNLPQCMKFGLHEKERSDGNNIDMKGQLPLLC